MTIFRLGGLGAGGRETAVDAVPDQAAKYFSARRLGFGFVDVAGEDECGVFGPVVGLPEAGDVVAGDGLDALGGADGAEAVGVVAVEGAEAYAKHGGDGLVAFLEDGDEALLADALDFFGGEGGMLDDVGEEVEACFGVVAESAEAGAGLVYAGGGGEVGADLFGLVGEDGGGALRGAFGEEAGGEAGETSLGGRVVFAAAAEDDACGEDGKGVVFEHVDLQAVGKREGFRHGKIEGARGAAAGVRSCASSAALRTEECRER